MIRRLNLILLVTVSGVGCLPSPRSNTKDFIPAKDQLANMFSGYDSHSGKFTEVCVKAKSIDYKPRETGRDGEVQIKDGVNFEGMSALIKGDGKARLNGPMSGSGEVDFAIKAAQTEFNRSYTIYTTIHQDASVMAGDFVLTDLGKAYADSKTPLHAEAKVVCGDEFVTEMTRGIVLLATVKISFFSKEDAIKLAGKLSVSAKVGKISGDFDAHDHDAMTRTKVQVIATQIGGNPQNLFEILPDDPPVCDLEDTEDCDKLIKNLYDYFSDFKQRSSQDSASYTPLTYKTQSYAVFDATRDLATSVRPPLNDIELRMIEERLRSQLVDAYLSLDRVNNIQAEEVAKDSVRLAIVKGKLRDAIEALKKALDVCSVIPAICESAANAISAQLADEAKFGFDRNILWND